MTITAQNLAAALRAAANVFDPQGAANVSTPALVAPAAQPAQTLAAPAVTVTEDQLTGLIMPHVSNEAIKAALGDAMRGLGVDALANAQPHQYGPLYSAFQGVLARFGIGGTPPQPAAAASII